MKDTIEFNNIRPQWEAVETLVNEEFKKLHNTAEYILGPSVKEFETAFKDWNHSLYAVGVSNATDGLELAARSLNVDKVTVAVYLPANTFIATFIGIYKALPDADYFLIDCDEYFQLNVDLLEQALAKNDNKYEKSIVVPVHLYGCTVDMARILELKSKYQFLIIEDCSQSHGSISSSAHTVGNDGDVSVFSLYPGKNLAAIGDAGVLTTNTETIYNKLLSLRNLGSTKKYVHEYFSGNHRLDSIQAIVLKHKLKFIDDWTENRRNVAKIYHENINNNKIENFTNPSYCLKNAYHIYPLRSSEREKFQAYLDREGVPTLVHYPIPFYDSTALKEFPFKYRSETRLSDKYSKTVLSIPMHPFMSKEQVNTVVDVINQY